MNYTQKLYEDHHAKNRSQGFSILKEERGNFFVNKIGKNKDVLDIGCRDGALTKIFVPDNHVTGVDVDSIALMRARKFGINTIQMDVYGNWDELENKSFDVVVAGEILEHLFHPEIIIQKVHAHLKSGGLFIGSVPNAFSLKNRFRYLCGSKKFTPLSDPTHINQFSERDLRELLSKTFSNVSIIGLGRYGRLAKYFPSLFAFDLVFVAYP